MMNDNDWEQDEAPDTLRRQTERIGAEAAQRNARAWPLGPCTYCHGAGVVEPTRPDETGMQECPRCHGEGGEILPIYPPEDLIA